MDLMESMIGQDPTYQAALSTHNLEGQVEPFSNRADVDIFRDNGFGKEQNNRDFPAKATPSYTRMILLLVL